MVIYDKGDHKKIIYDMWEENFHDTVPYADFYFDNVYEKNQVLLLEEENNIKGMLHWNSYDLKVKGDDVRANYIVGVATQEEFRRQGVMRKLLVETFLKLRAAGQPFTYLMPADENYYLPFDFRFGMAQFDQELEIRNARTEEIVSWEFRGTVGEEEKESIAREENKIRDQIYDIHTKISKDYLIQLEKEAKSDFARIIYVYSGNSYQGRFTVGTEDRFMTLSQVSCVCVDQKKDFLKQILSYCENRYHFGYYRLILDESWGDVLEQLRNDKSYRLMPTKKVPIIMFRILDLIKVGKKVCTKKKQMVKIFVKDTWLPDQESYYLWKSDESGSVITKGDGKEEAVDAGEISIGSLTNFIYGNYQKVNVEECDTLTEDGREWISRLMPLNKNCIMEIV